MLRQIAQSELIGASAVIRTLDVWFGYQWGAVSERVVRSVVDKALDFLSHAESRHDSIASADAETAYLALWATACEDAVHAAHLAAELLSSASVERRFVAVHLLDQINLGVARPFLGEALEDEDLRVALYALEGCQAPAGETAEEMGLFERIERLLSRLPHEKQVLQPIVWPWQVLIADRAGVVVELQESLGKRPMSRLLPYLAWMPPASRIGIIDQLGKPRTWDPTTRAAVIGRLASSISEVRAAVLHALSDCKLDENEVLTVEGLLHSDKADLRSGVIGLLERQQDQGVLRSITRLLESASSLRRQAGLELVQSCLRRRRATGKCRESLARYASTGWHWLPEEQQLFEKLKRAGEKGKTTMSR
jgi:hypothetical protein